MLAIIGILKKKQIKYQEFELEVGNSWTLIAWTHVIFNYLPFNFIIHLITDLLSHDIIIHRIVYQDMFLSECRKNYNITIYILHIHRLVEMK